MCLFSELMKYQFKVTSGLGLGCNVDIPRQIEQRDRMTRTPFPPRLNTREMFPMAALAHWGGLAAAGEPLENRKDNTLNHPRSGIPCWCPA